MVEVENPITKEKVRFYLDPALRRNLDAIKEKLHKKDQDMVFVIDGDEGSGKCQPKGSQVLMANGEWKTIENIKVGDVVLSPQENGTNVFSKVINTTSWFSKRTYNIHSKNRGEKKLYSCSYNHEIPLNIKRKNKWVVEDFKAEDLFYKTEGFLQNTTTPTMFAIEKYKDKKDCEIEPYTLGVFLGDGSYRDKIIKRKNYVGNSFRKTSAYVKVMKSGKRVNVRAYQSRYFNPNDNNGYCRSRHLNITSADKEIMNEVIKFYDVQRIINKKGTFALEYNFLVLGELSKQLEKCNLNGKGSGEKFIPKEALLSDLKYRKRLLAGLIDTDGYYNSNNGYEFTLKSKELIENIRELVYSIGGRCGKIREVKKGIKSINFVGTYYSISFYLGKIELPIKLERKKRKKTQSCFYLSPNRISIKLKEDVGKQVYGFTLDNKSHWYITDNFTITHNSVLAMQICKYMDSTFCIDDVCMNASEFKAAVVNAKQLKAIDYDEGFTGLSSRSSLSQINRTLVSMMMQMRQKNLFIVVALPSIFLLDRYVSMFRTKALIHVYQSRGRHLFFVFNKRAKKVLLLEGRKSFTYAPTIKKLGLDFKGEFRGKYVVDEQAYRDKKRRALEEVEEYEFERGHVTRDKLINLIHNEFSLVPRKIAELFEKYNVSLKQRQIYEILKKIQLEGGKKLNDNYKSL